MSNIKTDLEVNSLGLKCLTLPVFSLFDIKNILLERGIDIPIKLLHLFFCSAASLHILEHLLYSHLPAITQQYVKYKQLGASTTQCPIYGYIVSFRISKAGIQFPLANKLPN